MQITFINKGNRNRLICDKKDGGVEIADIGPGLPFHDIAHFIVERRLKLEHGFYGNIYNGYTVKQLSQKDVIKSLNIESGVAEITTTALQSLSSGACRVEQFTELVYEEFDKFSIKYPLHLTEKMIYEMLSEYELLIKRWQDVSEGERMQLFLEME
ncbi:MAG TPA: hypothetical protein VKA49_05205 [Flavitalea sp.]|nr:hypothetical protein [Flavitalea sp.]